MWWVDVCLWMAIELFPEPPSLGTLVPRSHQTFHPVSTMKLLGIRLRNRCWPITFRTITARDVDGWCQSRPV